MHPDAYRDMQTFFMNELRLMHYPVAIRYIFEQEELDRFIQEVPHYVPTKPLTFCQAEIGARMEGLTVLVEKQKLGCANAQFVFGWKGLDAAEVKSHMKYVQDEKQAEAFVLSKPRLPEGTLLAVAVSPLAAASMPPHVVHFYCDNMQAYHLAVDWMAAMNVHPLKASMTMNSAACGGNVHAYNAATMNVFLACSGSYNAGKTERGEINVSIPGDQLPPVMERLAQRKADSGGAAITRIGHPFPGADICKNCPLISFKKGGQKAEQAPA
jgi:uncharacterized protein (DUF169 family)